jgi:DNA replication protein DnaC
MANIETLPLLLKQLGLPMMFDKWEETERIANEKQWRHGTYLATLCEAEAGNRYQKRVSRHIKESKLPLGKTLGTFNFSSAKSVSQRQIEALSENPSWVRQANNLIIFGASGVGKTHLAAAIGHRLIEQGIRVFFSSTTALVQKLQIARQQYQLPQVLAKLSSFPLLILDDIGYVKKNEMETSVLFELIADRYETVSLIITANQPFGEWDSIFPDNMMTVAAIDRLVHHATILNITEESYRKAQAVQANTSKKGGKN